MDVETFMTFLLNHLIPTFNAEKDMFRKEASLVGCFFLRSTNKEWDKKIGCYAGEHEQERFHSCSPILTFI